MRNQMDNHSKEDSAAPPRPMPRGCRFESYRHDPNRAIEREPLEAQKGNRREGVFASWL
jgi:hypothetical protein